ncbi:MAG: DUF3098 domain-containing protein [Bacteroidota bacterium]
MSRTKDRKKRRPDSGVLFGRKNYMWAITGCLLVFTGFMLMYMENEVYGWISLNLSPVLILGGYGAVLFAIVKRFDAQHNGEDSPAKNERFTPENE